MRYGALEKVEAKMMFTIIHHLAIFFVLTLITHNHKVLAQAACAPGNFLNGSPCEPCLPGTYSDVQDATVCTQCAAGTSTALTGATICSPCGKGSYSDAGATECSSCNSGTFAGVDGSTVCSTCTAGRFASASGSKYFDCLCILCSV